MVRHLHERLRSIQEMMTPATIAETGNTATRRARIALILSSLFVLMLLAWSTWDHIRKRLEHERTLGGQVAAAATERLDQKLKDVDEQLHDFVSQEQALLEGLAADPDSVGLGDNLWSLIRLVFPDVSAALVLDAHGTVAASFGDILDEESERFLSQSSLGRTGPIHISGRAQASRADLATSWYRDGKPSGALLISLSREELCQPIKLSTPEGHLLSLRPGPAAPRFGETTETNAEHHSPEGALLAQIPLAETGWILENRLSADYVSDLVGGGVILGVGLGALFLLATLALDQWIQGNSRSEDQEKLILRETQFKLQAILSATTEGIVFTDAQGRVELFNPAAEMMFGRLTEDVLNADVFALLPKLFCGEKVADLLPQDAGKYIPPEFRETRGRRKGGEDFPVRLWVSSVRLDDEPHWLILVQDLTEDQRNEQHLLFLEQRDVLTGLLNRKEFERRLAALIVDESDNSNGPHAMCYVDVDQFKLVNDTCGHEAGDELLKQIAILFRAKMEGTEIISRLGSDEFGALFRNRTAEEAGEICDAFMQTVRNFLFTWRDQSFDVAVSIGLTEFQPGNESASNVLSKADVACHMAKTHGRDRVHIYHEGDAELVRHYGDMRLVSTISQALSEERFQIYAQPIVPIAPSGVHLRHFEVLVRMVDEDGNAVIPDKFIPAAERYILMPAVDRWIINRLFSLQAENLRAWQQRATKTFMFAVNLSGTSITDESFLRYLKRQFTDWKVPHQSICFEITETATVRNMDRARAFIEELSALGCSFALDDFGTGLSSYTYLKELPVDYLKIDGGFVRGMTEDRVDYAMVESINQIGHVLGLKTIAEWAENEQILKLLRVLKVDFAQGYAVGAPIPVCDFTLADAEIPPQTEDQPHERRPNTHRPRRSTYRPA